MSEENEAAAAEARMRGALDTEAPMVATPRNAPVMATKREMLSGVQLKKLASDGGFAVDDTTGDRMIKSLEGVIDSLAARWRELEKLQDSPPMSSTSTARWVSSHMQQTANDERGLLTQLQQARAEFPTYIEAINLAKKNYRERDQSVQSSVRQFIPEA